MPKLGNGFRCVFFDSWVQSCSDENSLGLLSLRLLVRFHCTDSGAALNSWRSVACLEEHNHSEASRLGEEVTHVKEAFCTE